MQVVSSAQKKKTEDMTDKELTDTISDIREVVEYLTRDEASHEEKCFSEEVKLTAVVYQKELERRRATT